MVLGSPYATADSFVIARQTGLASFNQNTAQNSNALFKITSTGNVGIGSWNTNSINNNCLLWVTLELEQTNLPDLFKPQLPMAE